MRLPLKTLVRFGLASVLAIASAAHAAWPEKPIRLIWPFAGGGIGNTLTRVIGEGLSQRLGQPVVVEERGGAGGIVGFQSIKNAPADGYTLLLGTNSTLTLVPSMQKNLPFDTMTDFEFIGLVAVGGNVIVVRSDSPIKSFADLRQQAKESNGKLTYGSAGNGTTFHLTPALFDRLNGSQMIHVPYKGSDPAFIGLLAGETSVVFGSTGSLQHIKAGKLRPLAVLSKQRLSVLPEVPTTVEVGMPELFMESFFGLMAPAGTPKAVTERLSKELTAVMASEAVRQQIRNLVLEPATDSSPAYFKERVRAETQRWKPVIEGAGIESN